MNIEQAIKIHKESKNKSEHDITKEELDANDIIIKFITDALLYRALQYAMDDDFNIMAISSMNKYGNISGWYICFGDNNE